jgi:hypothetical protein
VIESFSSFVLSPSSHHPQNEGFTRFACEEIQGIFPIGGLTTKQKRKEKKKKKNWADNADEPKSSILLALSRVHQIIIFFKKRNISPSLHFLFYFICSLISNRLRETSVR